MLACALRYRCSHLAVFASSFGMSVIAVRCLSFLFTCINNDKLSETTISTHGKTDKKCFSSENASDPPFGIFTDHSLVRTKNSGFDFHRKIVVWCTTTTDITFGIYQNEFNWESQMFEWSECALCTKSSRWTKMFRFFICFIHLWHIVHSTSTLNAFDKWHLANGRQRRRQTQFFVHIICLVVSRKFRGNYFSLSFSVCPLFISFHSVQFIVSHVLVHIIL